VIAVNFVLHHMRGGVPNRVVRNILKVDYSDLGSMIFHRGALDRRSESGKTCSCGVDFQSAGQRYGWVAADAGLMELVLQCSGNAGFIVDQTLFHHQ